MYKISLLARALGQARDERVALNNGRLTTARTRTCINNYFYGAIHKTIISLKQRPSDLKL